MTLYHVGVSGGKDSAGLLLWAVYESGLPRDQIRVTFCDTENEDVLTYAHVKLLEDEVVKPSGVPGGIERLIPALGFFPLARKKRRFPSRRAQFCTHDLKLKPTQDWIRRQWDAGHEVVVLNGKRSGETNERRLAMQGKPERAFSDFWGCEEWAPLAAWTLEDVTAIHERHRIPLNPLYALGARRVGCYPCVNCGKLEIRLVAENRPEKIAQIRAEELAHEAAGRFSSFFTAKTTTDRYRTKTVKGKDGKKEFKVAPIDEVVRWSQTERGGDQIRLPLPEQVTCATKYHACE